VNTTDLYDSRHRGRAGIAFFVCLIILIGAVLVASSVQRDYGHVQVTNVTYENLNHIPIRAKLLRPVAATPDSPMPGVAYIHGYQNNRETSDAYCIELARRGFVVLNIDAIGRGNSGIPNDPDDPDFDVTYGGWFYQLTGKIYLGARVNAALVAWMFTSSQVIAPIPV
jgi:cephalosporin-C deacetylase-like acetyl esterase